MSGAYTTTFEEMTAAANKIEGANDAIRGHVQQLGSQIAPLASAWTGSASTAFQNLHMRYNDSSNRVYEALRAIVEQIHGATGTYAAQEEQEQSSMNQITNALG